VIRDEIERTRARMTDTVDALGYKADVPSRARDKIQQGKDAVVDRANSIVGRVQDAAPGTPDVKGNARQAASVAQENPSGLALGAVAVGFIAGMMLPATNIENEKLGSFADDIKERAADTGREALEHGKEVAKDVAQAAASTAQESGKDHAQDLKESALDTAQETASKVKDAAGSGSSGSDSTFGSQSGSSESSSGLGSVPSAQPKPDLSSSGGGVLPG